MTGKARNHYSVKDVRFTPNSDRESGFPHKASALSRKNAQRFDDRNLAPFQYNTPERSLFGVLVLPIITHSNQFLVCLAVPRFWAISSHLPKLGCFDRRPMTGRTVS